MAADRGAARDLRADEIDAGWLAGCDHLHVSGYALMVEPVRGAALRAIELARAERARISVDLASWSAIRDSGVEAFRDAVRAVGPDVVFANEDEERVVGRSLVGARGSSSAELEAARSAATSARRCPSDRSSTRPAQETRSLRAGSSAGPTSRSKPPRAASSRSARCR